MTARPIDASERRHFYETHPGLFDDLERRAAKDGRVELSVEEAHSLCEAYRSLQTLLARTLRVSDLAQRQIVESRNRLQTEVDATRRQNFVLSQSDSEKNDVLALAAHDLRSPVATIHSLAEAVEMLLPEDTDPEALEFLREIRKRSDQAAALVTNILDGYRASEGQMAAHPVPSSAEDLANDLTSTWKSTAELKNISLAAEFDSSKFQIDPHLFHRVADNLVSNALKYSPPGSSVRLSLHHQDGVFRFTVRDEGPGISDSDQEKLFIRFSRLASPATGGEQSEGLGLALAARILGILGGTISYERVEPRGSLFRVEITCPPATE